MNTRSRGMSMMPLLALAAMATTPSSRHEEENRFREPQAPRHPMDPEAARLATEAHREWVRERDAEAERRRMGLAERTFAYGPERCRQFPRYQPGAERDEDGLTASDRRDLDAAEAKRARKRAA